MISKGKESFSFDANICKVHGLFTDIERDFHHHQDKNTLHNLTYVMWKFLHYNIPVPPQLQLNLSSSDEFIWGRHALAKIKKKFVFSHTCSCAFICLLDLSILSLAFLTSASAALSSLSLVAFASFSLSCRSLTFLFAAFFRSSHSIAVVWASSVY